MFLLRRCLLSFSSSVIWTGIIVLPMDGSISSRHLTTCHEYCSLLLIVRNRSEESVFSIVIMCCGLQIGYVSQLSSGLYLNN